MNMFVWPKYRENVSQALAVFCQGADFDSWNLGNLYDEVPQAFAKKATAKHGIFCSTGTAGLHASLMALGLKPDDEVIVPSMTFIRAVTPIIHLGLRPVIVDVDPETGNISPECVRAAISGKTKAVIVVHMWGVPASCRELRSICDEHNIALIEDFSHAHFSEFDGQPVGSFGDVAFGSLQRKKLISVGEGGIILTNRDEVYTKLQEITSPGSFNSGKSYASIDFSGFGLNMRMNPLGAIVAREELKIVDEYIKDRTRMMEIIGNLAREICPEVIQMPYLPIFATRVSWYGIRPRLSKIPAGCKIPGRVIRIGEFGYPSIFEHPFWKKHPHCYPFSQKIEPVIRGSLQGHNEYMKGRVSLTFPTISEKEWTSEVIEALKQDLEAIKEFAIL